MQFVPWIFSLSLCLTKKKKEKRGERGKKERKKGRKRGKKDQNTENERTKFAKVAVTRKTALEKKQKKKKKNNRIYRSDVENVVLMTERCGGNVKKKRHLASIYIYIYIYFVPTSRFDRFVLIVEKNSGVTRVLEIDEMIRSIYYGGLGPRSKRGLGRRGWGGGNGPWQLIIIFLYIFIRSWLKEKKKKKKKKKKEAN